MDLPFDLFDTPDNESWTSHRSTEFQQNETIHEIDMIQNTPGTKTFECQCEAKYKSLKTLARHQKTCIDYVAYINTCFEKFIQEVLPSGYQYQLANNSIQFECNNFDAWYDSLNDKFKYTVRSSRIIKDTVYKTLTCFHDKLLKCNFSINVTIISSFVTIKKFSFHTHAHDDECAMLKNPVNKEVKDYLIDLFYKGETPTTALKILKENYSDYYAASKNRSLVPNLTDVYYLFKKERRILFGTENVNNETINNMINDNRNSMRVKFINFENNYIVAFCTPKMLGTL